MADRLFQVSVMEEETHPSGTDIKKILGFLSAVAENNESEVLTFIKAGADIDFAYRGKTALFYAVMLNSKELVQALIEAGADVNITDDEGETPLFYCAAVNNEMHSTEILNAGDEERTEIDLNYSGVASTLIESGAYINVSDNQGKTALMCAVQNNKDSLVRTLVNAGADINITDNQGKTALMYAVENNHDSLACALIEGGADVSAVDKNGRNVLIYASIYGYENMVSKFKNIIDINHTDDQGKNALIHAVEHDYTSAAVKLIEGGADVNVTDQQDDLKKMTSALIRAGVDTNIADNEGNTALIYSLQNKNADLACALIEAGAAVNMTDKEGRTALIYWAQDDTKRECTLIMYYDEDGDEDYIMVAKKVNAIDYKTVAMNILKAGADINMADNEGKTALMYFLLNKNMDLACELIEAGAAVNMSDKEGRTALIYWAQDGTEMTEGSDDDYNDNPINPFKSSSSSSSSIDYKSVAFKILNAGADINMVDNEGKTALMYFLLNKNMDLACALIEAGAAVNMTDKEGRTALIYWAQVDMKRKEHGISQYLLFRGYGNSNPNDYKTVALKILNAGADINMTDNEGKTALVHSLMSNNNSSAHILIEAGADVNITDNEGMNSLLYFSRNQLNGKILTRMKISSYLGVYNRDDDVADCNYLAFLLITAATDLDVTDKQGKTALIYSLQANDGRLTRQLIDAGADVNVVDKDGKTALFYAAINSYESVAFLHSSTNFRNFASQIDSSLMDAIRVDRENIIKLIEAGADINISDLEGKTALMYYAENQYIDMLVSKAKNKDDLSKDVAQAQNDYNMVTSALIKASVDVNKVDNQGKTALTYFLQNNKDWGALELLNAGADVNIVDEDEKTALFYTPNDCGRNLLDKIVENCTDIDTTDNHGKTALMYAVENNNDSLVCALIEAGADVKAVDKNGRNALIYAVQNNNESLARTLVKAGADFNITDDQSKTTLMHTFRHESLACVLIEAGADVKGVGKNGRNLLIYASIFGKENMVSKLTKNANINHTDDQGKTALIYAVEHDHTSIVAKLIKAGADVNVTDKEGKTALIYFAQDDMKNRKRRIMLPYEAMPSWARLYYDSPTKIDDSSVSSMLIKAGANLNIADNEGKTALMYSVQNESGDLACALIEAGTDVNMTDKEGKTALMYWAQNDMKSRKRSMYQYSMPWSRADGPVKSNDQSVSSMLIKASANLDVTANGKTALMYSLQNGSEDLACALIEAGANVKVTDGYGRTALFYAISYGNERVVEALLKHDADVNVTDFEGGTALMHFAQDGTSITERTSHAAFVSMFDIYPERDDTTNYSSVASTLIKAGANINITDNEGKTALIYSILNNHESLAFVLIEAGADVKTIDRSGKTALFYALFSSNKRMIPPPWLVMPSSSESDEETSLMDTVQDSRESGVITKLIKAGADVNITYNEGKTALIYSIENLESEVIARALIEAGADVNVADIRGKTALIHCSQEDKKKQSTYGG